MSASGSASKGKGKAPAHSHFHEEDSQHEHEHGEACGAACGGDEEPLWPVVTAHEIDAEMEDHHHFMDKEVIRNTACLSDMAGMDETGVAVHRVRLAPGRESTVLHSHLAASEWIYILKGEVKLVLARTIVNDPEELTPGPAESLVYEETTLKAGDFAGFPAGPSAERWAHTLRAGNDEVEYLLGGDRKPVDVITYPVRGQTLVHHAETGSQSLFDARCCA